MQGNWRKLPECSSRDPESSGKISSETVRRFDTRNGTLREDPISLPDVVMVVAGLPYSTSLKINAVL